MPEHAGLSVRADFQNRPAIGDSNTLNDLPRTGQHCRVTDSTGFLNTSPDIGRLRALHKRQGCH